MAETRRNCELCNGEASVYCPSDSAFLCSSCDSKVHSANFLVARHVRCSICSRCRNLNGHRFSGTRISSPVRNLSSCRICSPEEFDGDDDDDSLSSSSSCVSSTTEAGEEVVSSRKRREKVIASGGGGGAPVAVDLKVEGVLVNWCRRFGVEDRKSRQVVATSVEILGDCLDRITILPFRVTLAAAFRVALRVCHVDGNGSTCRDLRKVEQISGVPAKLILSTESRLARVLKRRRSRDSHEEGWAEC